MSGVALLVAVLREPLLQPAIHRWVTARAAGASRMAGSVPVELS